LRPSGLVSSLRESAKSVVPTPSDRFRCQSVANSRRCLDAMLDGIPGVVAAGRR